MGSQEPLFIASSWLLGQRRFESTQKVLAGGSASHIPWSCAHTGLQSLRETPQLTLRHSSLRYLMPYTSTGTMETEVGVLWATATDWYHLKLGIDGMHAVLGTCVQHWGCLAIPGSGSPSSPSNLSQS